MPAIRSALFVLFSLVAGFLAAQESAAYVSKLTVKPTAQSVLLTWKDAEGFLGASYEIWRADKEIIKDTLANAKLLATVKAGVQVYEDTSVPGPSFYLVLLKDGRGNRQTFFIPFRNKTVTAVNPDQSIAETPAVVSQVTTKIAEKKLLIQFQALPTDRKLLVFRTTAPVTALTDLKEATLLGQTSGAKAPFSDTPAPGLEFYYTVVDALGFANADPGVLTPNNTTTAPSGFPLVALPTIVQEAALAQDLRPRVENGTRPLPLPRKTIQDDPVTGDPLPKAAFQPVPAQGVSPATEKLLQTWTKNSRQTSRSLPDPVLLAEEQNPAATGAAKTLRQLVQTYFVSKDWVTCISQLQTLLLLNLEPRVEARTRFYLGQAEAFSQDYRHAFLEILEARELYREESAPFLDSLFSLLPALKD